LRKLTLLAKLLIEKAIISWEEFMEKLSNSEEQYQGRRSPTPQ